jgi:hypothetical protein
MVNGLFGCITKPHGLQKDAIAIKGQGRPEMTVPQSLAVASLAGVGNVLLTTPIWLVVTRMQTASKHDRNTTFFEELRGIVQEGGFPALWTVILLTICLSLCLLLPCLW